MEENSTQSYMGSASQAPFGGDRGTSMVLPLAGALQGKTRGMSNAPSLAGSLRHQRSPLGFQQFIPSKVSIQSFALSDRPLGQGPLYNSPRPTHLPT